MKRKVSKIGKSSLLVSLPHQWVKKHNIKKGDEIELEIKKDGLFFYAPVMPVVEKKTWYVSFHTKQKKIIRIYLNTCYRLGFDKIVVEYHTEEAKKHIHDIVEQYLLGFEVVEETKEKIVIESLTEPSTEQALILLRKVFFLIQASLDILLEDMGTGCFERFEELEKQMLRGGKFCNFLCRTLHKQRRLDPFLWTMVHKLLIAHHMIYYCYQSIIKKRIKKFSPEILQYVRDAKMLISHLEKHYFKKEMDMFEKIIMLKDALLYTRIDEIQKTKEGIIIAPYLFCFVRVIPSLGATLSEIVEKTT